MTPKLNVRQQRFIAEYLIDGVGAAAATRAGYKANSAHVQASRLLSNDKILGEIEHRRAKVLAMVEAKFEIDAEALIRDVYETRRLALLAGQHSVALRCIELLARAMVNTCGQPNPFADGPAKLRHSTDKADMTSADLAREVASLMGRNHKDDNEGRS